MNQRTYFQRRNFYLPLLMLLVLVFLPAYASQKTESTPDSKQLFFDPAIHQAGFVEVKFVEGSQIRLRDGALTDSGRGAL